MFRTALIVSILFVPVALAEAPPTTQPAEATPFPLLPARTGAPTTQPAEAVLERKLPEIRFERVGLADAIDFFRDLTGAEIEVDWPALNDAGISQDFPVTARLRDVRFRDALDRLLGQLTPADGGQVVHSVRGNRIWVTLETK